MRVELDLDVYKGIRTAEDNWKRAYNINEKEIKQAQVSSNFTFSHTPEQLNELFQRYCDSFKPLYLDMKRQVND